MFRSQEMSYFQLVMPQDSAWTIMDQLGYLSKVEIIDHNRNEALINRPFANYVKRCDDLMVKIENMLQVAKNLNLLSNYKKGNLKQFTNQQNSHTHTYLDKIEEDINKRTSSFQEQNKHLEQLIDQSEYIQNYIEILIESQRYLGENAFQNQQTSKFEYYVGILKNQEQLQFHRVIFRVTKGNSYVHLKRMNEKQSIFIVLFPNIGNYGKQKIQKIVEQVSLGKFALPQNLLEFEKKLYELKNKEAEYINLIKMTQNQLCQCISNMLVIRNGLPLIEYYKFYLIKEKELYKELNKLKMQGRLFLGELWVPTKDIQQLEQTIQVIKEQQSNNPGGQLAQKSPPDFLQKPTYFKLNEFTQVFQEIVNTYGIPRYQEINPAIITIITFPFLFGVMFGDIGHGFVLFVFGSYLCLFKNKSFYNLRYLILLMGVFSFYSGLIYNDYLSLSLNLFQTCLGSEDQCVYPFGIDPMWGDHLEFNDSFKMKLSIIIAFCHMLLGVSLSGLNYLFLEDWLRLTCKFIPQLLFLICTIGYMVFLIIYKWLTPFEPQNAPSIITTMISMILNLGRISGPQMWEGDSQNYVQYCLLIICIITIPWMWLPSIISHLVRRKSHQQSKDKLKTHRVDYGQLIEESGVEMIQTSSYSHEQTDVKQNKELQDSKVQIQQKEHNSHLGIEDMIVHETIETLEYVLGVISNTASYLRLWALSLAHSQLSQVFFELLLVQPINHGQPISLMIGYPFWALITFGVLMCMDSMECFLHSLRLHWVEFQNKFFKGDGVQFKAYSFRDRIKDSINLESQ
ncbi:unnamed protein product (macronuclear) [Paramecium tetraurelia]|uniref:V-type proton ATPase subunit a n=1 Tax=Paramecium tetraurelia TaxID=5888 RepID=Q6BGD8_PARTE|nr:Vacuolar proton ATPase subunit a [Paramecium tetraurelia strain d4-2]XP_001423421.1 uncharacterized protein GSPATT00000458001 [Paramecium tetraurelia]CAH03282.1 Vacuolar proton ATPase subunit a, putative [Paramecium tetraurelia]CAI43265.1 V-ATPase a subunit 8_1 isotype of the V0 sector [Paramecium tetraurelia]CAK56023.1 unnamed protein product [Paramecium tetraurelia]|eukprot:XP_001423421.1 hypothetical protein (macronuclear) [Paramecium tetraurelia strain d4-2]